MGRQRPGAASIKHGLPKKHRTGPGAPWQGLAGRIAVDGNASGGREDILLDSSCPLRVTRAGLGCGWRFRPLNHGETQEPLNPKNAGRLGHAR